MHIQPAVHARRAGAGNALLVVVVLLLLASLFVLFALNVGRFEQKTSGNDLRAKIVQETADSGIARGVEYLNANRAIFATDDRWRLCGSNEAAFPCGAVPAGRRGTMYTYVDAKPDTSLANRLLPLPVAMPSSGGFNTTQQVGAVLCRVKLDPPGTPTACATTLADASSTWVITVVSKAALTGEGSSATATQTIGAYNIFSFSPNVPPLVASGTVAVGGGFQIVTAQDAAGPGVATSVWTRLDVDTNGTPNTCYFDDFLRQGGTSSGPRYYDGISVCDTCTCPTGNSLSYGQGSNFCEGADIVDIEANDANPAGCPTAPNLSIRREEFPRDLFAFLFGVSAWNDVNRDGIAAGSPCTTAALDCNFAEQRIILPQCTYPDPATGAEVTATSVPADTCHLLNIKNLTHIGDGVNDDAECAALGTGSRGIIWVHEQAFAGLPGYDCETVIRGLDQIGTPSHPVALIFDGQLTQVHFKLFGLFFAREPNDSTTLNKTTGGSAELGMNGGATIYGAAVVQGLVTSGGGGTAAVVYNKDVLFNLINDPNNFEPASIPGSWTDRLRY